MLRKTRPIGHVLCIAMIRYTVLQSRFVEDACPEHCTFLAICSYVPIILLFSEACFFFFFTDCYGDYFTYHIPAFNSGGAVKSAFHGFLQ